MEFQFRKSFQILEIFGQFSQPITQRDLLTLVDNGWTFEESNRLALVKDFTFNDFNETFGIMTRIAIYADGICHHPEWFNVYNNLKVSESRIFKIKIDKDYRALFDYHLVNRGHVIFFTIILIFCSFTY